MLNVMSLLAFKKLGKYALLYLFSAPYLSYRHGILNPARVKIIMLQEQYTLDFHTYTEKRRTRIPVPARH